MCGGAQSRAITESTIMRNVQTEVKGSKLVITVDISEKAVKEAVPSSTGKTKLVASTEGNQAVAGHNGMKFGLTVYVK